MFDDAIELPQEEFVKAVRDGVSCHAGNMSSRQAPTNIPAPSRCSSSSSSSYSSSSTRATHRACTTTNWQLRLDSTGPLTNYEKSAIIYNPRVDQLLEGCKTCESMFGAFFEADPNLAGLHEVLQHLAGKGKSITLIIGQEQKVGEPDWPPGVDVLRVPANNGGIKLFHWKILILEFLDRQRVWITSANLVDCHFGEGACRENAWVQDYPRKSPLVDYKCTTTFREELRGALESIEEIVNRLEDTKAVAKSHPALVSMRKLGMGLQEFDYSHALANLIFSMHSAKDCPTGYINLPREILRELTEFRAGKDDKILVCNGHTYEGRKNPSFAEFLVGFQLNVHGASVAICGESAEEFRGVAKVAKGKGRELAWEYWQPVEWSVKSDTILFQHHKLYLAMDKDDQVQWLVLGTHNFSASGWGRWWPYRTPKSATGVVLKKNEPKNAEISVFISGEVLANPEFLRLGKREKTQGGGLGLGFTLLGPEKTFDAVAGAKIRFGQVAHKFEHEHAPQYKNYVDNGEDEEDKDEEEEGDEAEHEGKGKGKRGARISPLLAAPDKGEEKDEWDSDSRQQQASAVSTQRDFQHAIFASLTDSKRPRMKEIIDLT